MDQMHAKDLKTGSAVLVDGKLCRVLSSKSSGTGKLSHKVHTIFLTIPEGKQIEKTFHPEDKLEHVDLDRKKLAFSYKDGDLVVFADSKTYEEFRVPVSVIAALAPFLKEDTEVEAMFRDGDLVDVGVPESVLVKVASCAAGIPGIDTTTPKPATLDNGLEVLVPQFIVPGDTIRVEVVTRKYMERIQT